MSMIERILSSLKLPASCTRFNKTLFKKLFYEHGELKSRDKMLFQEQVEKIVLHYNLTPKSTNIVAYQNEARRYLELPIVSATLKERKGAARIAEIIQRTLPHPCLLLLICGEADSRARKRNVFMAQTRRRSHSKLSSKVSGWSQINSTTSSSISSVRSM